MEKAWKKVLKVIKSRLFFLTIAIVGGYSLLVIRLFQLQIIDGEEYEKKLNVSIIKELPIPAPRGAILDRYGKPLAVNKVAWQVKLDLSMEPRNINEVLLQIIRILDAHEDLIQDELPISREKPYIFTVSQNEELRFKAAVFNVRRDELTQEQQKMDGADMIAYLKEFYKIDDTASEAEARRLVSLRHQIYERRFRRYESITVAADVSHRTIAALEERQEQYPGIFIDVSPVRYYPGGNSFSHILGYTGKITDIQYETLKEEGYGHDDIVGRSGIEEKMEAYLRGEEGNILVEVDQIGRRKKMNDLQQSVVGKNVFLTLDHRLQLAAERILVDKLTNILISRMSPFSAGNSEKPISIETIFTSLVRTNTISISKLLQSESEIAKSIVTRMEKNMDMADQDAEEISQLKEVLMELIKNKTISSAEMILLLADQDVITGDDNFLSNVQRGLLSPNEIMKQKLQEGEITPQNLALDPSSGSVVVTDVHTGEVLALVSYPNYDNNQFVNGIDYEYYKALQEDPTLPMFPRATQGRTAPGSTFKMLTGIAALEEGIVTPGQYINSLGEFREAGTPYPRCWLYNMYGRTHGLTNMARALEVSCNYYFYDVSYRMGRRSSGEGSIEQRGLQILSEYAQKLGLDRNTGIEIGEYAPKVSDRDLVRSAIGQGTNAYAPIHMAQYMGTLANGGTVYDLHLVDKIVTHEGLMYEDKQPQIRLTNDFQPQNLQSIYQGMRDVTVGREGTVRTVFQNFPIEVAGKTGTAQEQLSRGEHVWFVGYAPYENPQIAVVVNIPFGTGSRYSAEVFRDVVQYYFEMYQTDDNSFMNNTLY